MGLKIDLFFAKFYPEISPCFSVGVIEVWLNENMRK